MKTAPQLFRILPAFLFFTYSFFTFNFYLRAESSVSTYDQLLHAIRETRSASEQRVEAAVEQEKVREAWETGKLIDEHILLHKERADYGEQVVIKLAKDLDSSETELRYMLQFARTYPIHRPADELTWSHYQSLLAINDPKEREEVIKEAAEKKWTRDQVRDEVRRRQKKKEPQPKLPEAKPGKVGMYRVSKAILGPREGELVLDLGFDNFYSLKKMAGIQSGDILYVTPGKKDFYNFTKAIPKSSEGKIFLNAPKNPIFADESDLYTYEAYVARVIDGDTFEALIDLGFGITTGQTIRLLDIDAPEMLSAEGKAAKTAVEKILAKDHGKIIITSHDKDHHGRALANVFIRKVSSPKSSVGDPGSYLYVNQELVDQGQALAVRGDS